MRISICGEMTYVIIKKIKGEIDLCQNILKDIWIQKDQLDLKTK